ncbi:amino acid ABC transporter substrate-binding protein [Leptolyngbya sp. AN02str]|uniref:amino acid ABC transporter substrate-binding protein n=1 Tax=Leptolyngbya sp. AN02str TaxID=3423363 RepID=UPI003D3203D7
MVIVQELNQMKRVRWRWSKLLIRPDLWIWVMLLLGTGTSSAYAESVLERVSRTGVLTAGSSSSAGPFASQDAEGNWVGYSIDILHLVRDRLAQTTGQNVRLEIAEASSRDRMRRLQEGQIDIVCDAISATSTRQVYATFSLSYFVTGTQFLVKQGQTSSPPNIRVGLVPGSTNADIVRLRLPLARLVSMPNLMAGVNALNSGRIDAFASDGVLLEGLRRSLPNSGEFSVFPTTPYSREEYACLLPKHDPDFQSLVNQTLLELMQGVVDNNATHRPLFDQWFGQQGNVPIEPSPVFELYQQQIARAARQAQQPDPVPQSSP